MRGSGMKAFLAVPIPRTMEHLPRDKRGYPIPAGIWFDENNEPHFTINDEEKRQKVLVEERCGICHKKLFRGKWFVGGPLSCYSVNGRYIDPPMHRECAEYALKVCPYLAAPRYAGRIDIRKVPKTQTGQIFSDPTMIPDRPDIFVLAGFPRYKLHKGILERTTTGRPIVGWQYIEPKGELIDIAFYRHGQLVPPEEAAQIVDRAFEKVGEGSGHRRKFGR